MHNHKIRRSDPNWCLYLAANDFVQAYYKALESNRDSISAFYDPTPATLLLNGNSVATGAAIQDIFKGQMPEANYEIQSFDCQVINRAYPTPKADGIKPAAQMQAKDMSILILVSGHVRYGEGRDQPQRGFSETFVLVPNAAADRTRAAKKWLIQSQNFRLVV